MSEEKPTSNPAPESEAEKTPKAKAEETPKAKAEETPKSKTQEETVAQATEETAAEEQAPTIKKAPTAEELLKEELGSVKIRKAKGSKNITTGIVNIVATFNNTIVTISDQKGNVISWSSGGKMNFRGSRKSTAYAGQVVSQDAARAAMAHGLKEVIVKVKGPGMGRDSAIRALQAVGLEVLSLIDVTPIPHNGCRPPKRRRV
jgi:small subunit ribosomal protein S11